MTNPLDRLKELRLLPLVTLDDAADAEPVARALMEGGLPVAEVTFRTGAAVETISRMSKIDGMLVGAGTVLTVAQAEEAVLANAAFAVSPGSDAAVIGHFQKRGVPIYPGTATPTDIQAALSLGLSVVKFFPAEAYGGVKTLKALGGPFRNVRFIPTGGISPSNMKDYLALDSVVAVGGSWIAPPELVRARKFDEITRLAREAAALAR